MSTMFLIDVVHNERVKSCGTMARSMRRESEFGRVRAFPKQAATLFNKSSASDTNEFRNGFVWVSMGGWCAILTADNNLLSDLLVTVRTRRCLIQTGRYQRGAVSPNGTSFAPG